MKKSMYRRLCVPALLFLPILLMAGCEEDVTAVLGTDMPYSVYGLFSPDLDTQWVRVFPIEPILEAHGTEPLDATVTSHDEVTGETIVWRDTLILETRTEIYEHAFWAPFVPEYGRSYQLSVTRSDGLVSSAAVTVPEQAGLELEEADLQSGFTTQRVLVTGDVPQIFGIVATYITDFVPIASQGQVDPRVSISYDGDQVKVPGGWQITVNLADDFRTVAQTVSANAEINLEYGLRLLGIELRLVAGNADWAMPEGGFDPEVIVEPGVMDNVDNGFGFVAAGYRLVQIWTPSKEAQRNAGFTVPDEDL